MKRLQIAILINCALVFLLSSFCTLVMATEYFQNEVTFTSIDRFDSNGLVGEPQKVLVPATFRRPLGEGKFPAIVIANSSEIVGADPTGTSPLGRQRIHHHSLSHCDRSRWPAPQR